MEFSKEELELILSALNYTTKHDRNDVMNEIINKIQEELTEEEDDGTELYVKFDSATNTYITTRVDKSAKW
jgi:hypothetical protein